MTIIFGILLLFICILIPRISGNYLWVWTISLTIWLTVIKAPWPFFIVLWLICWFARDKTWRDNNLIAPLHAAMEKFFS